MILVAASVAGDIVWLSLLCCVSRLQVEYRHLNYVAIGLPTYFGILLKDTRNPSFSPTRLFGSNLPANVGRESRWSRAAKPDAPCGTVQPTCCLRILPKTVSSVFHLCTNGTDSTLHRFRGCELTVAASAVGCEVYHQAKLLAFGFQRIQHTRVASELSPFNRFKPTPNLDSTIDHKPKASVVAGVVWTD